MRELGTCAGRVLIGANEAAVHALLPLIGRFRRGHPDIQVDVRRVPSRQVGVEVLQGSLDFGVVLFSPRSAADDGRSGRDELVCWCTEASARGPEGGQDGGVRP